MMLIDKYLRYLRYEKNYSSHTEISYSIDLKQFVDFLSLQYFSTDLLSVDSDMVRGWISHLMDAKVSARSVNRKLSTLKSFYRYLLRVGDIKVDPMRRLVGPKIKKPIPSFVKDADMDKLLEVGNYDDSFESVRCRTMLELFYVTGMRRAELISLRDEDVDLDVEQIRVLGKRNKQRLIPISKSMKLFLCEYIAVRNREIENLSGFFFVTDSGQQLYPMLVYRIVTNSLRLVPTLSKTNPHVLRHSFATSMLNNGADINAVKDLLGHSSLASTEVYTHTSFKELKEIYNKAHPRA